MVAAVPPSKLAHINSTRDAPVKNLVFVQHPAGTRHQTRPSLTAQAQVHAPRLRRASFCSIPAEILLAINIKVNPHQRVLRGGNPHSIEEP